MNSYRKLCTEFYDLDKPKVPQEAFEFYWHYAEKAFGPILELMCGSGRFLIPFLESGFDIDGVDASPHMLQSCRDQCHKKDLMPTLYEQCVEAMDLPRKYSLVFIPAGSFCLITDRSFARESLRRIYDTMSPRATFVVEAETLNARPTSTGRSEGRWVERADGTRISLNCQDSYCDKERILRGVNRYDLFKDGALLETELEELYIRLYEPAEFRELLEAMGFRGVKMFETYQFSEPDTAADTIVFECHKP